MRSNEKIKKCIQIFLIKSIIYNFHKRRETVVKSTSNF